MEEKNPDLNYIQELVYEHAAIVPGTGNTSAVESRLTPVMRQEGVGSLGELVGRLRSQQFNGLHWNVIEAMTAKETSFFRDVNPYETLRTSVLPQLLEGLEDRRELRIWSAACSSGQEPYSIAMLLREHFPALADWRVEFFASDISREMIERAREGCYSQMEVNRGLPAALLVKYFQKAGVEWQVNEEIREMIQFRQINLAGVWPLLPTMDIILMRNVLTYFDSEKKKTILRKAAQLLKPHGYLLLGGAETTVDVESFDRVQFDKVACYRLHPIRTEPCSLPSEKSTR